MAKSAENHAKPGVRPPPEVASTLGKSPAELAANVGKELGAVAMSLIALVTEAVKRIPEVPGMIGDKIKDNHMQQPS